jgi:hypothetical protein
MTTSRPAVFAFVVLALSFVAGPAAAKGKHDSPYSYEQTFGTALRLVKVDLDFTVDEANSEWGYLVFKYVSPESGKRKNRASFTFVRDEEHHLVHVKLQIPSMPGYHEQVVLNKLRQKLEAEHGDPPVVEEPEEDDEEEEEDPNAPIIPGQDSDADKDKSKSKRKRRPRRRPARSPRRAPKRS